MNLLIKRLNKNLIFKFISSVKLAVPLMLVIATVIAVGTIYESQYNAQVAQILIYRTWWFEGLMVILWLNIFCAAVSRIPFQEHHLGFVITHIGLLTLLIGASLTAVYGIDGQLRVLEGQRSNVVFLSDLVVKATETNSSPIAKTYYLNRELKPKTGDQLGLVGLKSEIGIILDNYLPFVTPSQTSPSGGTSEGTTVSFSLESRFFNVSESLNTSSKPEMQMGPAVFRIVPESPKKGNSVRPNLQPETKGTNAASPSTLVIKDFASGQVLQSISLAGLKKKPVTVNQIKISLVRTYEQAMVSSGKLIERGQKGSNPALELKLESSGKSLREVAFNKFPTFSLNPKGALGLSFEYQISGAQAEEIPMHGKDPNMAKGVSPPMGAGTNVVEFRLSPSNSETVRIVLLKNGTQVLSQSVKMGEVVQTPWMGMKITVNSLGMNGKNPMTSQQIQPSQMIPKKPLPPSAIFLRSDLEGAEGTWIVEGTSATIQTSRGNYEIYYGDNAIELPFNVKLDEFRKVNYPGTDTAMSFESTIRLNDGGLPTRIQMNEPFQHEGYLLYQSSYEQGPGIPTASIFSVNHDPGRFIKYLGAIILVIGIGLFTLMRTKLYFKWKGSRPLKVALGLARIILLGFSISTSAQFLNSKLAHASSEQSYSAFSPEAAQQEFTEFAKKIDASLIEALPVQSHGRVKPLDSFARESVLFLTGKFSIWGLQPVQVYLGLLASESTPYLQLINIRDPDLRVKLGFKKEDRHVSLQQLSSSPLQQIAQPVLMKQEQDEKSLNPEDKKILEVAQQYWLLKEILTRSHFEQAAILNVTPSSGDGHGRSTGLVMEKLHNYLGALKSKEFLQATLAAIELIPAAKNQPMPELFQAGIPKLSIEVTYNHLRPFFWVGILYMLIGIALASGLLKKQLTQLNIFSLVAFSSFMHISGFAARVYITGFAPVTNMYGTMVWMALGVVLFGSLLFVFYRNTLVFGILLLGSSATLLLTESIPLILSPDMDPIVAVLRSNFWLTIHVLTISISYAAFTIAMIIGNTALVQTILKKDTPEGIKNLSHLAYRAIQLGVFLLTAGIILGGWWADYSWGRFWGWDPKETWALIADLGFISILHARYAGWLKPFGVLTAAPIAYLLIIMAWYGVNFILAAGLHSYGFSSGGATLVISFIASQFILVTAGVAAKRLKFLRKMAF